jgi:peptide/nickel transport system substrate-binding protein
MGLKGFRFENYGKGEQKVKNRIISIGLAIALAFSVGLIGCGGGGVPEITKYNLTISSTEGGSVTSPGQGTFSYDEGEVVNLVAEPEEGYQFTNWIGDMVAIADINAAITTITMSANYSITACFELKPTGAFLDDVLVTSEPDASAAIQRLKDRTLDIYAYGLPDPALYAEVSAEPDLTTLTASGGIIELTFNPVGPTLPGTGKLNPFSDPKFREAMNWLVDRDYIAQEIYSGLAIPRYTCLTDSFVDAKERYPDLMAAVREKYAHNLTKAAAVITTEMQRLGAVLEGGKWMYKGQPVEIIGLIRTEDERKDIGDYFADLLEGLGFTVTRQYGTMDDLYPIWLGSDPALGTWHFYTGGWGNAVICREEGTNFGAFYTNLWSVMGPLWQAYVSDPEFYEAAKRLWNYDCTTMEERRDLFEICIPKSMEDNVRMFLVTDEQFTPMRANVLVAADLVGGVSGAFSAWGPTASNVSLVTDHGASGSWPWALTAHFVDDRGEPIVGGTLKVAMPDVLTDPWNPVAGSDWVYDTFAIRATGDRGLQPDPRDGLRWPGRIERAEVYVQEGLPMAITHDWLTLESAPEIAVPADAWADWDAAEQRFITVAERFPEGTTALWKSVVYYPKDIFTVPLHDGSTLSMGDFILHAILRFDRAKEASPIYDESTVLEFNTFMETSKGVKFITDDPNHGLIVETYSDFHSTASLGAVVDAELCAATWFPGYDQNPYDPYEYSSGVWHATTLGIMAEEDGALAFSQDKANMLGVEWMNFLDGPSLPILKSYLDKAKATNYIPYEPTMGQYVTEAEAAERWSNLERWYAEKGHFWVGSGPFYLESANTAEKVVHLKKFEGYPDLMDKWLFLLEPLP